MSEKLEKIRTDLGDSVSNWQEHHNRRFYCDVAPDRIMDISSLLFNKHGLRLATVSGVDMRSRVEILYHFSVDDVGAVISVRVSLDKADLEIDSLAPIMKAAEWIEREIHEMLGVKFKGHPNLRRLLLADDWPEGNYPLRRDSVSEEAKASESKDE